jgi:hypothetical protein
MKKVALATALVLSSVFALSAYAQTTKTAEEEAAARAKRKAETSDAVKAGTIPKGEGGPTQAPTAKKTAEEEAAARAKRKNETAAAVKAGETPKAGEAGAKPATTAKKKTAEEEAAARAKRKAETSDAVKAGTTPKAGDAPTTK